MPGAEWRHALLAHLPPQQEETLSLAAVLETARLAKCLINYITASHSETVPVLYELIHVFRCAPPEAR